MGDVPRKIRILRTLNGYILVEVVCNEEADRRLTSEVRITRATVPRYIGAAEPGSQPSGAKLPQSA